MTGKQLWTVKGIWVVLVVMASVVWRGEAAILIIGLLFIRPVLREAKLCRDMDERQQLIFLSGGYYGFMAAMLVVLGIFLS